MGYLCGMKLYKRIFGEGKTVVILHGLFGSSDNWQTFGKNLSESGFRVVLVDLRNHGQSPHDDEFNYTAMAEDINELFKDESLEGATVIGHSLGGKVALKFAYMYPDSISGIIVVDIAPRHYPVHHRQILDALMKIDTTKIESRSDAEEVLSTGIDDDAVRQFLLKNLYWKEKDKLDWRFNLSALNRHIEEVGEPVYPETPFNKPMLFIKGENSNYISDEDEREISEHFTNAEVKTAPGASHWVHAENPVWLMDVVKEFMGGR